MRRTRDPLRDDVADLRELTHQGVLRMQPAGGIDEEHVDASCDRRLRSIEDDRGGIGAFGALDEFDPEPLRPDLELRDRARSEGVGGGKQHASAFGLEARGDLRDARRLARAVDADDEDHRRLPLAAGQRQIDALPAPAQFLLEKGHDLLAGRDPAREPVPAKRLDEFARRLHADVRREQTLLDLRKQRLVDAAAREERPQAHERLGGAGEPALQDRCSGLEESHRPADLSLPHPSDSRPPALRTPRRRRPRPRPSEAATRARR